MSCIRYPCWPREPTSGDGSYPAGGTDWKPGNLNKIHLVASWYASRGFWEVPHSGKALMSLCPANVGLCPTLSIQRASAPKVLPMRPFWAWAARELLRTQVLGRLSAGALTSSQATPYIPHFLIPSWANALLSKGYEWKPVNFWLGVPQPSQQSL